VPSHLSNGAVFSPHHSVWASVNQLRPHKILRLLRRFLKSHSRFPSYTYEVPLRIVEATFAGTFLDTCRWVLLLATTFLPHFEAFPHLHSAFPFLSFPFSLPYSFVWHIASAFCTFPSIVLPTLLFSVILLWFFIDDQITCPSFKILFFHSGDRDRGFGFPFCD